MHIHPPEGYAGTAQGVWGGGTDITFRHVGSYVVFDIDGPLAARWVTDELCAEVHHMLDAGRKNLILDLSDVPMADSAGIGALVAVRTLIHGAEGNLVLFSAQRRVREVLKRTRLDSFFTFSDDPTFPFAKV
jgi:anti-sigma B factor antagonist